MKRLAAALYIMMCSSLVQGATLLFSDNFEGTNPLSTNYTGCTSGTTPIGNVTISTVQAHGGTKSAFYRADGSGAGHDETAVCIADLVGNSYSGMYISMWMYFTTNLTTGGHAWRVYPAVTGNLPQFDTGVEELSGQSNALINFTIDPIVSLSVSTRFGGAFNLPKAQWVRTEILFQTGANGSIKAWYTDNSGLHNWNAPGGGSPGGQSCASCSATGCTGCNWSPALALTKFALATNNSSGFQGGWYTDDIQIWDGCPGSGNYACVSGGADTSPPAAPRNVRVL